jgi:6-phosphogluconolactonase (cycloisomerase 2 family)
MSAPLDAALSNNSKFLYVLNSGTESITALSVSNDGSLHFLQDVAGLPDGSAGLAAK